MGRIAHFAIGAQAEVETNDIDEIEIYFSQQIAPGFFAWLVPTKRTRALVGVISSSHARLYLNKLLVSSFCQGKVVREDRVRQKLIPLGTLPRTYGDRVLVVGDAADDYDAALRKMRRANCRHLPIVDGNSLLGVISLRDLLQVDINEKDDKIEFLTNYMFHVNADATKKYPK